MSGNLTYLDLDVIGTDEVLRDRPKWRGGIDLVWQSSPRTRVNLDVWGVGRRYDYQVPVTWTNEIGGFYSARLLLT